MSDQEAKEEEKTLRAPSLIELLALYLILGMHIILCSGVAVPREWMYFEIYTGMLILLWLIVRVILIPTGGRLRQDAKRSFLAAGVGLALLALLHFTTIPLCIRVALSSKKLTEVVENTRRLKREFPDHRPDPPSAVPAGYFRVLRTEADTNMNVWITTVWNGRVQGLWAGLVYCEKGEPPRIGESTYGHLYGPWWWWDQDL